MLLSLQSKDSLSIQAMLKLAGRFVLIDMTHHTKTYEANKKRCMTERKSILNAFSQVFFGYLLSTQTP